MEQSGGGKKNRRVLRGHRPMLCVELRVCVALFRRLGKPPQSGSLVLRYIFADEIQLAEHIHGVCVPGLRRVSEIPNRFRYVFPHDIPLQEQLAEGVCRIWVSVVGDLKQHGRRFTNGVGCRSGSMDDPDQLPHVLRDFLLVRWGFLKV